VSARDATRFAEALAGVLRLSADGRTKENEPCAR
jgi:hypothetical protein